MTHAEIEIFSHRPALIPAVLVLLSILVSCEKLEEYVYEPQEDPPTTVLIDSATAVDIMQDICNTLNGKELLGIQVCVTDSLGNSWKVSMGATEPDQVNPLLDDHLLRIGSVTKIYTAALIMRLMEGGYLTLDQEISEYFPGRDNVDGVTIRNLLSHSSGIADIFTIPSIFINSSNFPDKQWDPRRLAEYCMKKPLLYQPGTDQSYSNTNYILLGLIAAQVTGKPVSRLYREYLLDPCGFENTCFVPYDPLPAMLVTGYVHHYALSLTEWYPTEPENTSWPTVAFSSGAMAANASELSEFIYHLFRGEVVSRESLRQMTEFNGNRGLGLTRIRVNDRTYFGHEGEITGFECITGYYPGSGWVITICCNTTPFRVNELLDLIDARL